MREFRENGGGREGMLRKVQENSAKMPSEKCEVRKDAPRISRKIDGKNKNNLSFYQFYLGWEESI